METKGNNCSVGLAENRADMYCICTLYITVLQDLYNPKVSPPGEYSKESQTLKNPPLWIQNMTGRPPSSEGV